MFGEGLRKQLAAQGRVTVKWHCTTHARDDAAETAGEWPTGACWGALKDPRPGAALGCMYERMDDAAADELARACIQADPPCR